MFDERLFSLHKYSSMDTDDSRISREGLPAYKFHRSMNIEKFICSYASKIFTSCFELQYMRLQD